MLRLTAPSPSGLLNSKRAIEDSPRTDRPSIITTDQNIEAVERIVIRDQQISMRRLAYQLAITATTTVHEITSNHLLMKKISTRWVPKLLTLIQPSQIVVKSFCKTAK